MNSAAGEIAPMAGAIVVDSDGFIVAWNEGAEAVLGYVAADVVGRAGHDVLCGRGPTGKLYSHPYCPLTPGGGRFAPTGDLILFPRTATGDTVRVTLSMLRVPGDDPSHGWLVHVITSAETMTADQSKLLHVALAQRSRQLAHPNPSASRRATRTRKPPESDPH